jgi:hypothetical protein
MITESCLGAGGGAVMITESGLRVTLFTVVAVLGPRVHRYLVRPSQAALRPLALDALPEMTSPQVRVPDSIAIVGYDDIDFAAATPGGSGGSAPRASTAGGSGGSAPRASTAGGSGGSAPRASTAVPRRAAP